GLLVGAVPLFGFIGCLLLALGRHGAVRVALQRGLSLEQRRAPARAAALEQKRAEQQVGSDLDSIVDALKDRDKKVRIAAIDALKGDSSADAVRILAKSRDNTVFDVRMRAVEGLARIAKQYGDRIAGLKNELQKDPQSPELHRRLADLAVTYGGLGIEDPSSARALFETAVKHAQVAAQSDGVDRRLGMLVLARAWRELGKDDRAEKVYRELLETDPHDCEALVGVAATQFGQRNFSDLHSTCRWVLRQAGQKLDAANAGALKFWVRAAGGERR
ncbi:MAG: HEAT repeat domain-containing protein, partial [Myxococcaceae bacterium]